MNKIKEQILAIRATGRTNMFDVPRVQYIANEMHFSKPSVSVAMKNLRNRNYITVTEEGFICLTEQGLSIAQTVYERHSLLSKWLMQLGVSPDTAVADACKMEHDISPESFGALKKHILLHFPSCRPED